MIVSNHTVYTEQAQLTMDAIISQSSAPGVREIQKRARTRAQKTTKVTPKRAMMLAGAAQLRVSGST
jgi:hypothetical protein